MKKILMCILCISVVLFEASVYAYTDHSVKTIPMWEDSSLRYSGNEGEEGYVKAQLIVDENKAANGLACGYVYCGGYRDNTFGYIGQQIDGLEQGADYILTAKVNSSLCIPEHAFRFGESKIVDCQELKEQGQLVEGQWCDIEFIFTYTYSSNAFRIWNWNVGDLYVDDISLRKVEYDGETIVGYGKEIISNGDFESDLDFTPCAEVSNLEVKNMDERAEISWNNPKEQDFSVVRIYELYNGTESLVKETSEEQVILTGLVNNKEVEYLIKTVDIWGNCSSGYAFKVCPVADPFKSSDITITKDSGVLTATASFKNNKMSEDCSVEMILVIFQDGALTDINSSYAIIPVKAEEDDYTPVSVSIPVPTEEYTAAVYVWDSMTEMNVLLDKYIIN